MKVLIYSMLFACIAVAVVVRSADVVCPEDGNQGAEHNVTLIPDAKNCSRYIMCDRGVPVTKECPAKLHFNPKLSVCDYPDQAGCRVQ